MPRSVTSKQLTQMRSFASRRMKTTCTVKPVTNTTTSHGGTAYTWGDGTATVCDIYPGLQSSGRSLVVRDELGDQLLTKVYWTVILPYNTTVSMNDKIEVGSQSFRVVGFPDDQSFLVQLNLVCEEIQT